MLTHVPQMKRENSRFRALMAAQLSATNTERTELPSIEEPVQP